MKIMLASAFCLGVLGSSARSEEPAAADRPATALGRKREQDLKAGLAAFRLDLKYFGPQDKPFYQLTLSTQPVPQLASDPFHPLLVIDRAQAEKIVALLAGDGYLDRAVDELSQDITLRAPQGPTYYLNVQAQEDGIISVQMHEDLGWLPKLFDRLDALKKVLDPKPAAALDTLITRLGPRREGQAEQK